MNRVVLSSDVNLAYAFTLPVACLAWARRGYRPLVLLAGEPGEWFGASHLALAVKRAREVGAEVYWVGRHKGVRSSTVAQCARFFAAAAPGVEVDDVLVTSDVDMIPIGPWVGSGIDDSDRVHLYYANAYEGSDYVHFPMCYLAAKASVWWSLVCMRHSTNDASEIRSALAVMLMDVPDDSDGAWNWDERWFGKRIEERLDESGEESIRRVDRTFVEGEWRVDRSDWTNAMAQVKERGSLAGVADAHLPKPCFMTDWDSVAPERWSSVRPLFEMLFSVSDMAWVDDYRAEWLGTTCRVYPPVGPVRD